MPILNNANQDVIDATDQCVMCGLCLPHCPTYAVAKNEAESPRGRIALVRAIHENKLQATPTLISHLDTCLTCMNCEAVCPANVDYARIIDAGREFTYRQHGFAYRIYNKVLLMVLTNSVVRNLTKLLLRIYFALGLNHLLANAYKRSPSKLRLFRLLPHPQKINIGETSRKEASSSSRIVLANSCAGDLLSDQTINAAKHILKALDCYIIEKSPTQCCGALHQHNGDLKKANLLMQKFSDSLIHEEYDALISLATGCGAQLTRHPDLFSKQVDVNSYVLKKLENSQLKFRSLPKLVLVHKPCTQSFVVEDQIIEKLLSKIPELQIKHFQDKSTCCGAGGLNALTQATLADKIIRGKVAELKATNPTYLVSSNIGCAQHFQASLGSSNNITICHPVTLLAQQMI